MEQHFEYMVYVSCMTYNHSSYIKEALDGFCFQQTNFPYVCAVIDDSSTDGEKEVISQYLRDNFNVKDETIARREETDDYVMIFARHNNNNNCYFAVFFLKYNHHQIRKSKLPYVSHFYENSKYYSICEGDDYWIYNYKLQDQVDFMEAHPEYSMCFTNVKDYSQSEGKFVGSPMAKYDNAKLPGNKKDLFYYILLGKCRIQTLTVLYRQSIVRRNNDKKFMMGDTPLWLDLSQNGPIKYMPDITGVYRISIGTASRNPKTILRFQISMFEMRIYYCEKYGYEVPMAIRRKYNISLVKAVIDADYDISKALYPLYKMNFIQTFFYKSAQQHRFSKYFIELMWKFENRLH